ncbi:DNA polymerase delta, subunit 4 domain-containing protein [Sarocladium implicatum]|nr:DNA polymerase delta, subunit 4 domain-containing protein [Sarocladium implicatum]
MPTTRRSAGNARGPTKGQSTISFHHKVTKATAPIDAKNAALNAPSVAKVQTPVKEEEPTKVEIEEPESEVEEEPEIAEPEPEKSESEVKAEKVSDAQIAKFWKSIEKERTAPRVHQQDLSLSEKVLRYFDVSSQFGPCVGISRMKRWQRAERLGLNPPIEVFAVLLKEEKKGTKKIETAHIDEILNSGIAVGA